MTVSKLLEDELVKRNFLWDVIKYAPNGSVWGIQGLYEQETVDILSQYFSDCSNDSIQPEFIYPDYCVKLISSVKPKLKEIIDSSNLVNDIIEHIYISDSKFLFIESYDALSSNFLRHTFLPDYVENHYLRLGLLVSEPR